MSHLPTRTLLLVGLVVASAAGVASAQSTFVIATEGEVGFAYDQSFHPVDLWSNQLTDLFGEPERREQRTDAGPYLSGATDLYYPDRGVLATTGPDSPRVRRLVFFLTEIGPFSATAAALDTGLRPGAPIDEATELYGEPFQRRREDGELSERLEGDLTVLLYRSDYFAGDGRMFGLVFREGGLAAVSLLDNYAPHVEGLAD